MAWLTKRGLFYYIKFSVGAKKRRVTTGTGVFQIAKEKLRRFEDAQARGGDGAMADAMNRSNQKTLASTLREAESVDQTQQQVLLQRLI
jgi:hypothetical protein